MSIADYPTIKIYTKASWAAAWTERSTLKPVSVVDVAAPEMSKAVIVQYFGEHNLAQRDTFAAEDKLDLLDQYVQIDCASPDFQWTGIVIDQTTEELGRDVANPTGTRTFVAYGLDHILDMTPIEGSWCKKSTGDVYHIHRSLTFNVSHERGGTLLGNRTAQTGYSWYFEDNAQLWTIKNILEYLLAHYCVAQGPDWELGGLIDDLDQITEIVSLDGLTVRQALNKLIDRRRGYGWCIRSIGAGTATIHIFSLFAEHVIVGDLAFSKNAEQGAVDMGEKHDPRRILTSSSYSRVYDRVRVQGGRIKACFNVRARAEPEADEALIADWTAEDEQAYKDGAKNVAGYSDWPAWLKREENDRVRAAARFKDVYSKFRIRDDWGWGGNTPANLSIGSDDDFILNGKLCYLASNRYPCGRPLLRWLPLKEGIDYRWPATWTHTGKDGLPFRAPFVLVPHPETDRNSVSWIAGRWLYVDDLRDPDFPNGRVSMEDRGSALRIQFSPNHLFASPDDWAGHEPSKDAPLWEAWRLKALVAIELDERLTVEVQCGSAPSADFDRMVVIGVPDAELWYIIATSDVGLYKDGSPVAISIHTDASNLVKNDEGSIVAYLLRDDSPRLRAIALLAREWYGIPHASGSLQISKLKDFAKPGKYITNATCNSGAFSVPINSVVTKQAWDFESGTTTIDLSWWDVDWRRVAPMNIPGYVGQSEFVREMNRAAQASDAYRQTEGE